LERQITIGSNRRDRRKTLDVFFTFFFELPTVLVFLGKKQIENGSKWNGTSHAQKKSWILHE
jgi:hypothetical protein